ncbi:BZ3500_MvSof-1268-A1-R1_Chr7-2g09512 [Microbotryum saponariae]|uniref:BZ3500_MvSof-1268-A1-R1_Chr7-2g09512 protein n=1 Tax=Microbotryum saponariae TaxID=289078 RepID=A0A2X0LC05_9BASI|nr:BZ3501_MvSof-1269-A2-R1_Chr7-1g09212 [Microbotryum saponariae]SDA02600.1 BZ3500_MvSof-1268-A1-R1_Chr7-2g09512 [Microbotryum saponariae]
MATPAVSTPRARARLGKKEKQALRDQLEPAAAAPSPSQSLAPASTSTSTPISDPDAASPIPTWPWASLNESIVTTTCPVVYSPDAAYCFIASSSQVKIYSTQSTLLLSTLAPPQQQPSTSTASSSPSQSSSVGRAKVTALLLNPTNPLQLLVASFDGTVRVWDYYEGRLLRTIQLGAPVLHACGHPSLGDHLFVALAVNEQDAPLSRTGTNELNASASNALHLTLTAKRANPDSAKSSGAQTGASSKSAPVDELRAGIYSISLRPKLIPEYVERTISPTTPRDPARRVRLANPRIVRSLAISPSGAHLIALNPHSVNICRTAQLQRGFTTQLDSSEALTTVAFHPVENYFATGNERGQIRLWYDVLDEEEFGTPRATTKQNSKQKAVKDNANEKRSTAVYHWHKHPVAALTFTANGAYLLSGGEEAVMVLWQLHTGHTEFVPRLGAPILALSIAGEGQAEQQVAARLRDGTVVFIGTQRLKITKTISGLKADPVRLSAIAHQRRTQLPLAVQPSTKALVVPAGHPSSIQFYSPSKDSQLLELEVSPSNRVSSAGEVPIEPTRVERVTFSTPALDPNRIGGTYWMATLDTWIKDSFAPTRHLKFWEHKGNGTSFVLSTRIDRPHNAAVTSMAFSPSPASPLLLTTSMDGVAKLWAHVAGSWRCQTSFEYRGFTPYDAAWSQDGSMFAIAHDKVVTLWSLASNALIHVFACSTITSARKVGFVGQGGTTLLAGGTSGSIAWDLLTFDGKSIEFTLTESLHLDFEVNSISNRPRSSLFIATEKIAPRKETASSRSVSTATRAYLIDASTPPSTLLARQLPFAVRQLIWYDVNATSNTSSEDDVSLAIIDDGGDITLVGDAATFGSQIAPSKLPRAASTKAQSRLFDEIYGKGDEARTTSRQALAGQNAKKPTTSVDRLAASMSVLDAPAHSLPPVKLLWRTLLGGFGSDASVEVDEEEGAHDAPNANGASEDADKPKPSSKVRSDETTVFVPSPDSLADIFKAGMVLVNGTGSAHASTAMVKK